MKDFRTNEFSIKENLREALENIFDLREDEVLGEKKVENITQFYGNENLAQGLSTEWMR